MTSSALTNRSGTVPPGGYGRSAPESSGNSPNFQLAQGLQSAGVALSSTLEHTAVAIRILDENEGRAGRIVTRVTVGREFAFESLCTLEQSAGEP